MFKKISSFFSNFFPNAKDDPVSTIKGIVQVAGGVYIGYVGGMTPPAMAIAVPLVTSGLHAIGSDTTAAIIAAAPQLLTVTDHAVAIKNEQDKVLVSLAFAKEALGVLGSINLKQNAPDVEAK